MNCEAIQNGNYINYEDIISKFPDRSEILNCEEDFEKIKKCKPIKFFPFDLIAEDYFVKGQGMIFQMLISGITETGLKIIINYRHTPFIYLRIPDEIIGLEVVKQDTDQDKISTKGDLFLRIISKFIDALGIENVLIGEKKMRYYRSDEYQNYKGVYVKIEFRTLYSRKLFLSTIHDKMKIDNLNFKGKDILLKHKIETSFDDKNNYHLMVCREDEFDLCGWNNIEKYNLVSENPNQRLVNSSNRNIPVETIWGNLNYYFILSCDKMTRCDKRIDTSNSLTLYWDIECVRYSEDGLIPDPENSQDEVFIIGLVIANSYSGKVYGRIGITGYDSENSEDSFMIKCKTEKQLIEAFYLVISKVKPEFIMGYNDGNFDWPFIIEKSVQYDIFEKAWHLCSALYQPLNLKFKRYDSAFRFLGLTRDSEPEKLRSVVNYIIAGTQYKAKKTFFTGGSGQIKGFKGLCVNRQQTKIEANINDEWTTVKFFGITGCDVMVFMRIVKRNPEENSLSYFLSTYNLPQKLDMPIHELFSIAKKHINVRDNNFRLDDDDLFKMKNAKDYCIYDAEACCLLINKVNYTRDRQLMGSMSFIGVHHAMICADGVKIRNLLMYKAKKDYDILYTTYFENESVKFPGAFVVPPQRGMQIPKLSLREKVLCREFRSPYYSNQKYYLCDKALTFGENVIAKLMTPFDEISQRTDIDEDEKKLLITNFQKTFTKELQIEFLKTEIAKIQFPDSWCDCCDKTQIIDFWSETTGRPVSALDFASLYPSIMMVYNLSKEKIVRNPEHVEFLKSQGKKLQEIKFDYIDSKTGETSTMNVHFVRHNYDPSVKDADRVALGFGVFPSLLLDLKQDRKKYKNDKAKIDKQIKSLKDNQNENNDLPELLLTSNYYDAKQNAVKIFMNSFYGQTGSDLSQLYMFELAGGVTSQGQYNLKLVIKEIEEFGCKVLYGDTDSTYLHTPESNYLLHDIAYYSGKITKVEYCQELIRINVRDSLILKDHIANVLTKDNGTGFLTMEFEESLFPVALLAKKNYFGIEHKPPGDGKPFNPSLEVPDKPFMKGLASVKRGMPEIAKKITRTLVKSSIDIKINKSILYLVEEYFDQLYNSDRDIDEFVITSSYNPTKQNKKNITFVNRMREEHGIIIRASERFKFVFIDKPAAIYDYTGKIIKKNELGDIMELASIAKEKGYKINARQYFETYICGIITQFASTDSSFSDNPKEAIVEAKKYINEINEKFMPRELGCRENQQIYRKVRDTVKNIIKKKSVLSKVKLNNTINCEFIEKIREDIKPEVEKSVNLIIKQLYKLENNIYKKWIMRGYLDLQMSINNKKISHYLRLVNQSYSDIDAENLTDDFNDEIPKIITEFRQGNIKSEDLEEITKTKIIAKIKNIENYEKNLLHLKSHIIIEMQYQQMKTIIINNHIGKNDSFVVNNIHEIMQEVPDDLSQFVI